MLANWNTGLQVIQPSIKHPDVVVMLVLLFAVVIDLVVEMVAAAETRRVVHVSASTVRTCSRSCGPGSRSSMACSTRRRAAVRACAPPEQAVRLRFHLRPPTPVQGNPETHLALLLARRTVRRIDPSAGHRDP
jgi:hypothetical protein